MEKVNALYAETENTMEKALSHFDGELAKFRAGKANPQVLAHIMVDYYGSMTALDQVANVSTPDARTIVVQPWEKALIEAIEKSIIMSNIGLTPQNDGNSIRIFIPPLTEERRKDLVKSVNSESEKAKIAIRSIRKDAITTLKGLEKSDNLSEDIIKDGTVEIQKITDTYIEKVDQFLQLKEKEIMTI